MFARLLFTKCDETYPELVGGLVDLYFDLEARGLATDDAIDALFDLANLEMRRQQRLGRESPPLSRHSPVLTRNKK